MMTLLLPKNNIWGSDCWLLTRKKRPKGGFYIFYAFKAGGRGEYIQAER
jgi:hypothetical protein